MMSDFVKVKYRGNRDQQFQLLNEIFLFNLYIFLQGHCNTVLKRKAIFLVFLQPRA